MIEDSLEAARLKHAKKLQESRDSANVKLKSHIYMILSNIFKKDASASAESAAKIAEIWEEVVNAITEEMFERFTNQTESIHINLREEMILELAKFRLFISEIVVDDRMKGRSIAEIDFQTERDQCLNETGKNKISNTARNFAEQWLKRYNDRWKLKTDAALKKEGAKKNTRIIPKRVEKNHFISRFFITAYWSEDQFVYRNIKGTDGLVKKKRAPVGGWGFRKNLYSDYLEAYFGLLESDAVKPIQMILNVEPLNQPQREALVGFIVIQRLRNPHFIKSLENAVAPVVASEVGEKKEKDSKYMRSVYESLYRQNDFYNKLAKSILYSRWVIVRSGRPIFVLPDVCNLFGFYKDKRYVVMPLTPTDCLIILPVPVSEPRIIPHYIKASESMDQNISYILRSAAIEEFLSDRSYKPSGDVDENPNEVMHRVILSLTRSIDDDCQARNTTKH